MKYSIFLLCLTAFAACKQANDKNPFVPGKWQGVEWLIADKPSDVDATKVQFEFKEDGTYSASFGAQQLQGTWRTEQDKLYTTETGKKEIVVKLLAADGNKLEFEMNRGGQKEVLKLTKQ